MRHLRTLAQEIGPRPSTKEGERRAGEYIASVFKTCGLAVERMPFRSVPSFSYTYGVIFLGALISVCFLFAGHPLLAAFLSALCVVVFYLENSSFETVSRLLAWGRSQNILGKIPPKIPSPPVGEAGPPCREALQGELRGKLIIVSAHYDSSRSGLSFHPKLVGNFRASFLVIAWALRLLPLLCLLPLVLTWSIWISLVPSLVIAFGIIAFIHREVFGEYVCGANDNASGTVVLLGLAEELKKTPLKHTEVWLLATGCEEAGLTGMIHFVRRYGELLRTASCINIDAVGKGTISFITKEGMLRAYPSAPHLLDTAGKVSRALGGRVGPGQFRAISTDSIPLLVRGYPAMSVMGLENGMIPNWHWRTDTVEHIDRTCLETAYFLVRNMLHELDE